MSVFTRKAHERADGEQQPNCDLPAGYDDEDSFWFVPENLRPHYRVNHDQDLCTASDPRCRAWITDHLLLRHFAQMLADEQSAVAAGELDPRKAELAGRDWPLGHRLRIARGSGTADLSVTPDLVARYLHRVRLSELNAADRREHHRRQLTANRTCEVCGIVEDTVQARQISDLTVRACPACNELLVLRVKEGTGTRRTADGTTTAERADAYLAQRAGLSLAARYAARHATAREPATPPAGQP